MRKPFTFLFLSVLLATAGAALYACAPGPVKTGPELPREPDEQLFVRAQAALRQEEYGKALTLYDQYRLKFPEGRRIPQVLYKMGEVLRKRGDFTAARRQYELLLSRFPHSSFQEEARLGILKVLYERKKYQQALRYADQLADKTLSQAGMVDKYIVVADSYQALGQPLDGAYVLVAAMRMAGEDGQRKILIKLDQATRQILPGDLQVLLSDIDDSRYRGHLTCRLGEKYMQRGDYDRAAAVLWSYINKFPDTEYARQARKRILEIDRRATYEHYVIGCLLPLTGKYEVFGKKALQGIELAFQQLGAGVSDDFTASVKLVIRDTGSDPRQAIAAVNELFEKKVAAIIGPLEPFVEAVREVQKNHIPVIVMTQKENIPEIGSYVFQNFLTPTMQVHALVSYVCDDLGLSRLAVLYPDESYGRVFAHRFWDEVLAKDGTIVGFEKYDPQETDFAEPIQRLVGRYYEVPEELAAVREQRLLTLELKEETGEEPFIFSEGVGVEEEIIVAAGEETELSEEETAKDEKKPEENPAIVDFEALFIPDGPSNVGLILPQLAYHDVMETLLLGTNLWHSPGLIRMAKVYAHGSVMTTGFWEKSTSDNVASFVDQFQTLFGEKPGFVSAVAYDTANILFSVLSETAPVYRSGIRDKIHNLDAFSGVTGCTAFAETGEAKKEIPLLKIAGREFVPCLPAITPQSPKAENTDR